tara:strand:- start:3667 stop:4827 length:1161 start_codon:yes stop_codon:yes gene_type:complete
MELYNAECIEHMKTMEERSVDLFVLDLPYANKVFGKCTAMGWDTPIDLAEMWIQIKRIMKPSAVIVHFCNVKFGFALIQSNPKWFRYDLIWKKSRKVGFLSANKQPLRQHENVYIFKEDQGVYNPQKTEGKPYNKRMTGNNNDQKIIYGKCLNGEIHQKGNRVVNKGDRHPTSIIDHENMYVFKQEQGTYNPQKTEGKPYDRCPKNSKEYGKKYKGGEDVYTDDFDFKPVKNDGYRHPTSIVDAEPDHENMYVFKKEQGTYNPQKTEGKPYIDKRTTHKGAKIYGDKFVNKYTINTGDRHPASIIENTILEHNNPHKPIHRTQKPVSLLEWLIKSYSNEGDVVMDFCMGSGTAGIACLNTKRHFIGVERDEEIFNLASDRIEKHEL